MTDHFPPHLQELLRALPTFFDPVEHVGLERILSLGRLSRFRAVDYVCAGDKKAHRLAEVLLAPPNGPILLLCGPSESRMADWVSTSEDIWRDGAHQFIYRGRPKAIRVADLAVGLDLLPGASGRTVLSCRHGRHVLDLDEVAQHTEVRVGRVVLPADRTAQ